MKHPRAYVDALTRSVNQPEPTAPKPERARERDLEKDPVAYGCIPCLTAAGFVKLTCCHAARPLYRKAQAHLASRTDEPGRVKGARRNR